MDRRDFLTLRKNRYVPAPQSVDNLRGITSGLNPYSGAWTTKEVAHLLKRTMFGAAKADIDYFKSMSVSQAVDALLGTSPTPAPPVKEYDNNNIPSSDPDFAIAQGATWVNTYTNDGTANAKRIASLKAWWTGLMLNQDRTITEKMVLFWHNHFATETNSYNSGLFGYRYYSLLRANALGNFKQLVKGITIDGAMLYYLNNYVNTDTAPDENYARELQELFTLGRENNPSYTEDDVRAAAKVLTGWRIDFTTDTINFNINRHDKTNKQFSAFYNNTVITGRTDANAGNAELDDLLNMIFSKSVEVSEFMVRNLYRWFCYYTIDATTETNVIKPLAQIFRDSNWELKPVLAALLKSEHFFDPLSQGCLIKSPLEAAVGMCREFNVVFPPATDYENAYNMWTFIKNVGAIMQQNLGDPPNVSGWSAYYQAPQFYEIWINSDTLPKRNQVTDLMVAGGYTQNGKTIEIDVVAFTKTLPNPSDPNLLINDALDILYRVPISDQSKQIIKKQILLTNQTQDYYWTNAWNAYIGNPSDMTAYNIVETRLKVLYKYFMNLAEYQLA
jgi:uncharacterized protein (DUF1800 family)